MLQIQLEGFSVGWMTQWPRRGDHPLPFVHFPYTFGDVKVIFLWSTFFGTCIVCSFPSLYHIHACSRDMGHMFCAKLIDLRCGHCHHVLKWDPINGGFVNMSCATFQTHRIQRDLSFLPHASCSIWEIWLLEILRPLRKKCDRDPSTLSSMSGRPRLNQSSKYLLARR